MAVGSLFDRQVRAGDLRHVVSIERVTRTADSAGGFSEDWDPLTPSTVHAAIEPLSPNVAERIAGSQLKGRITHVVRVRQQTFADSAGADTFVRMADRVTFGDRVLMIRGKQDVFEEGRALVLLCEELAE